MNSLKTNIKYHNRDCNIVIRDVSRVFDFGKSSINTSVFTLTDENHNHISGYYLFSISSAGCYLYKSVSNGNIDALEIPIDTSNDDMNNLLVTGVDEIE